jgi:hypothetical protein
MQGNIKVWRPKDRLEKFVLGKIVPAKAMSLPPLLVEARHYLLAASIRRLCKN